MGKLCSVKSCPIGRKLKIKFVDTSQPVSFFRPTTLAKLEKWNMALGTTMKKTDYICHLHFKEEDIKMYETFNIKGEITILPTLKKTLRDEALPTINHQFIPIPPHELEARIRNKSLQQSSNHNQPKENKGHQVKEHKDKFKQKELVDQELVETKHHSKAEKYFDNIKSSLLPQSWMYFEKPNGLELIRTNVATMKIVNRLRINKDLSVNVIFSTDEELTVNDNISSFNSISDYLKWVERWPLCVGTQFDQKKYSPACKGVIVGDDSYKRNQANPRCKSCRILRHRLQNSHSTQSILETTISQKQTRFNLQKSCQRPNGMQVN